MRVENNREHTIDDVVEILKNSKINKRGVVLLVGAGASVEVGIPTANGLLK